MRVHSTLSIAVLVLSIGCGSDQPAGKGGSETTANEESAVSKVDVSGIGGKAGEAIQALLKRDASLKEFFEGAHGFAIFPTVGKGGLIIGGGGGSGVVFEQGKQIGKTTMKFVSVGAQIGGQSFSEVIFFKDKVALDNFKRGNFEMGAQVSAVAVDAGVASDANYDGGVAVFTMPKEGLMAEASVSGQKFEFEAG